MKVVFSYIEFTTLNESLRLASSKGDVEEVDRLLEKWNHKDHDINETDKVCEIHRHHIPSSNVHTHTHTHTTVKGLNDIDCLCVLTCRKVKLL